MGVKRKKLSRLTSVTSADVSRPSAVSRCIAACTPPHPPPRIRIRVGVIVPRPRLMSRPIEGFRTPSKPVHIEGIQSASHERSAPALALVRDGGVASGAFHGIGRHVRDPLPTSGFASLSSLDGWRLESGADGPRDGSDGDRADLLANWPAFRGAYES